MFRNFYILGFSKLGHWHNDALKSRGSIPTRKGKKRKHQAQCLGHLNSNMTQERYMAHYTFSHSQINEV